VTNGKPHIMLDLVRCGPTLWEQEGRLHGSTDLPPASGNGVLDPDDVRQLAEGHPGTVYHPPDEAATDTARRLARTLRGRRVRTRAVAELSDPHLGLLEGLHMREFAERHPKRHKQWQEDPLAVVPPEGEPIAEARDRLLGAVSKLLRRSRAEEIALVLHPIALGLLRCRLAERPASEMWRILESRPTVERYAVPRNLITRLAEPAAEPAVLG
jgi:broad specificity phosphatase PhoE